MFSDEYYMKIAYNEALKCLEKDEVPVGAIIVRNNEIIAAAHNTKETTQIVTNHAETLAINEACQKLKSWRLDNCVLYTTLEPCLMCSGVIISSRIPKVVYGAKDDRWLSLTGIVDNKELTNHQPEVVEGILQDECSTLIKEYFKNKR